ncbi:Type I transmembrane sorting receptor, partial [Tulasnella sp. 427]
MLQTPLLSATAYLAILASLVSSSPVAPNNLPKARIVSFQSNHAVARNSEDFSYSKLVERDFNRIQRFKERTQEWMPTKTVKQGRSVSAAEPFDIGPLRRSRKRKTWAQDPLLNNGHDTLYYGNLTVGSSEPGQQITMNFDTGSSDLLVPTQNCTRCPGPWFNPFGSTTFVKSKKRRTKWYGDGSFASGYISTDTVSLGSLSVPNQTFILVDEASPGFAGPNTGVIGLAFQPIATTAAKPWFIGLADQGA